MGASVRPEPSGDRIMRNVDALRQQGASDDDIEAYLAQEGLTPETPSPAAAPPKPARMAPAADVSAFRRPGSDRGGDLAAVLRGADAGAAKVLAAEANLIRGIKPLAMLGTGARALFRGQSYDEAKQDLAAADELLPSSTRSVIRAVGAAPAAFLAPASTIPQAAASGALFGAADAMTDDPNVSTGEAVGRMAFGAGVGSTAGAATAGAIRGGEKVGKLLNLRRRINSAPDFDESAVARDKEITKATKENYKVLDEEAAASAQRPTTQDVAAAFEDPDVAPFIAKVRASRRFKNADDATVAREADKLMTRQRRGYEASQKEKYDADIDIKLGDLSEAQKVLRRSLGETGTETTVVPAMRTAQSPAPTVREAIDAHQRRLGQSVTRKEGTVAQQKAREALERHDAENVVSPPLRGAPAEHVVESEVPAMLPSHGKVVGEKARMEREREAASEAAKMASRVARNLRTPPEKAHMPHRSPAAYLERIKSGEVPRNEIEAALPAFLSGAKRDIELGTSLPLAFGGGGIGGGLGALAGGPLGGLFGAAAFPTGAAVARTASRLNRLSPFVDALDAAAGNAVRQPMDIESMLRLLGLIPAVTP